MVRRNAEYCINPYSASRQHFDFLGCFSEKIKLGISCESSACQMIHMNTKSDVL